ncbi:hypothetical protein BDR26DRAFT_866374 [Obelidium mucronatum]|nr:hypothetical protein BDR26DRAFT_866374 [Obelidium mucronatum]
MNPLDHPIPISSFDEDFAKMSLDPSVATCSLHGRRTTCLDLDDDLDKELDSRLGIPYWLHYHLKDEFDLLGDVGYTSEGSFDRFDGSAISVSSKEDSQLIASSIVNDLVDVVIQKVGDAKSGSFDILLIEKSVDGMGIETKSCDELVDVDLENVPEVTASGTLVEDSTSKRASTAFEVGSLFQQETENVGEDEELDISKAVVAPFRPEISSQTLFDEGEIDIELQSMQPSKKTDSTPEVNIDEDDGGDISMASFATVSVAHPPILQKTEIGIVHDPIISSNDSSDPTTTIPSTGHQSPIAVFESIPLTQFELPDEDQDISLLTASTTTTTFTEPEIDAINSEFQEKPSDNIVATLSQSNIQQEQLGDEEEEEGDISMAFSSRGIVLEPTLHTPMIDDDSFAGQMDEVNLEGDEEYDISSKTVESIDESKLNPEHLSDYGGVADFDNERMLLMSQAMDMIDSVAELIFKVEKLRKDTHDAEEQNVMLKEVIENMMMKGVGAAAGRK